MTAKNGLCIRRGFNSPAETLERGKRGENCTKPLLAGGVKFRWLNALIKAIFPFMTAIKSGVFTAIAIVAVSAVPSVLADARPNPYLSIVDRNPFGIKPPLPPPTIEQPQVMAPLAKVVLTGVENMFGKPRALLEITESEPGKGPVVNKRILREGERDGSVEVLAIDVANS